MKDELKQVRTLTVNRLQSGAVPGWSWNQHVRLVEAIDAVLQDMSVLAGPSLTESPEPRRHGARRIRLAERNHQQDRRPRQTPLDDRVDPGLHETSKSRPRAKTPNLH